MSSLSGRPSFPVAVLAMVGSAAAWGGATVMTKSALAVVPPFTLLVIQLGASVAALWSLTLVLRVPIGSPRRAMRSGASGLLEPGLAYAVGVPGLALTTASNASVIAALEPVFVIALAFILYRERASPLVVACCLLAIAGTVLVSATDLAGLGSGSIIGDGLVLAGTAFAAGYVVLSSRLVGDLPPLLLSALQQSVGWLVAIIALAIAIAAGLETLPTALPMDVAGFVILSGLVQYALAFWLYLVGLRRLPVGTAGLFLTLTPVFGVGGALLFLGEAVMVGQLAGMLMILAAIGLIVSRRRA